MIQLYAMPGACSLASHIIIKELDLPYELKFIKRDDRAIKEELKKINPMGQVPTIVTDEGYPLAEGSAILQYLISKKPNRLFPESDQPRFKGLEWLNFISSSLHKAYGTLFNPGAFSDNEAHFETIKRMGMERLKNLLQITESKFPDGDYTLGADFTIVDAYLFVVLNWSGYFSLDLSPYRKLKTFMERMRQRPSVIAAMKAEGIWKD